jgi:hypothetical protein
VHPESNQTVVLLWGVAGEQARKRVQKIKRPQGRVTPLTLEELREEGSESKHFSAPVSGNYHKFSGAKPLIYGPPSARLLLQPAKRSFQLQMFN